MKAIWIGNFKLGLILVYVFLGFENLRSCSFLGNEQLQLMILVEDPKELTPGRQS